MASVTKVLEKAQLDLAGVARKFTTLEVAELVEGDNVVGHGLLWTPRRVSLRPSAGGGWGETQAPNAANLYFTVAAGGAASGAVDVIGW